VTSLVPDADDARVIKRRLLDPVGVCQTLGLEVHRPDRGGCFTRLRDEKTPSARVSVGPEGTLRVVDFGSGFVGDVYDLIAHVHGWDARRDFPRVLQEARRLAGESATPGRPTAHAWSSAPPREYPPQNELLAFWDMCIVVGGCDESRRWLEEERGIRAATVDRLDLARALPPKAALPRWAHFGDATWRDTGHMLIVPMWDADGSMRSVRACRVRKGQPKRLPPTGHRASGVVMADVQGRRMLASALASEQPLRRVVICEGEPDWLSWCTWLSEQGDAKETAVLGVVNKSWTDEIGARVPDGTTVVVRTHLDEAGDRYAEEINASLGPRCSVLRLKGQGL
jgi:hypothetical protein